MSTTLEDKEMQTLISKVEHALEVLGGRLVLGKLHAIKYYFTSGRLLTWSAECWL
jgi:hypothetical protein